MLNESLLQIKTTVEKYTRIMEDMDRSKMPLSQIPEYWEMIPAYGVSRCPYCGKAHSEVLDTYTLRKWIIAGASGYELFWDLPENKFYCEHMVYTQAFVHLHGIVPQKSPTELKHFKKFVSEVPHVVGFLLTDDVESHAVLHSLPMCRIEGDQFVPRYTLYMVTQYGMDPDLLSDRMSHYTSAIADDWRSLLVWPTSPDHSEWFNLEKWVKKGKLSWIEPENPEMKLVSGPLEAFPYAKIEGRRSPYYLTLP